MSAPLLWINVGCGWWRAPDPWINTDVWENDDTHPDIVVSAENPFPFPPKSVERAMLGHVLEHIPLPRVPTFLAELSDVLAPGAEVLVVCPDVYRTIRRWHDGAENWALVTSVLEHAAYPGTTDWPEALHAWNCHEARLVEMMQLSGFDQVTALSSPPDGWPVVGWADWQCCVSAIRR